MISEVRPWTPSAGDPAPQTVRQTRQIKAQAHRPRSRNPAPAGWGESLTGPGLELGRADFPTTPRTRSSGPQSLPSGRPVAPAPKDRRTNHHPAWSAPSRPQGPPTLLTVADPGSEAGRRGPRSHSRQPPAGGERAVRQQLSRIQELSCGPAAPAPSLPPPARPTGSGLLRSACLPAPGQSRNRSSTADPGRGALSSQRPAAPRTRRSGRKCHSLNPFPPGCEQGSR